jgi:hypothetical protein
LLQNTFHTNNELSSKYIDNGEDESDHGKNGGEEVEVLPVFEVLAVAGLRLPHDVFLHYHFEAVPQLLLLVPLLKQRFTHLAAQRPSS